MSFGDRFLASDLAAIRSTVAATNLGGPEEKAMFAQLMEQALLLNPAQEDAYYLAQAILPWQGRVDQTQKLLDWSSSARPWDWLPVFFRAFNGYYFLDQPNSAAHILKEAADRSPPSRGIKLEAMAGRWSALGKDPQQALQIIRGMRQGTSSPALRRNLEMREEQLQGLIRLQAAARAYTRKQGEEPPTLQSLVGFAGLDKIPDDPMGDGYSLDNNDQVRITPPNFNRVRTPGSNRHAPKR